MPIALDNLCASQEPYLIGVRHHSACLARIMPELLDAIQPDCLLIEMPLEAQPWIPYLGHPETQTPVALAVKNPTGLAFLPFADFSPELAAIRWAQQHQVRVVPCDLPSSYDGSSEITTEEQTDTPAPRMVDTSDIWDQMIEARSFSATPEELRRAALRFGLMLREKEDAGIPQRDIRREAWMVNTLNEQKDKYKRIAAVVGSFHAASLLQHSEDSNTAQEEFSSAKPNYKPDEISTSLIPYSFPQLDERSGYPAGIRDPIWHQGLFTAQDEGGQDLLLAQLITKVCHGLRERGHNASTADARACLRMSRDLAALRGMNVPGRQEFLEAAQSTLARGEVMGLGRAVANAMQDALIGTRRGILPKDCPRSGLVVSTEALLQNLGLPGPEKLDEEPTVLRLDPLRNDRDRARVVTLQRFLACSIPYGTPRERHREGTLTEVWEVTWQNATAALLEDRSVYGIDLAQATAGLLQKEWQAHEREQKLTPDVLHPLTLQASQCGIPHLVSVWLPRLVSEPFLSEAKLSDITQALILITTIQHGHEPGLPSRPLKRYSDVVATYSLPTTITRMPLLQAALKAIEGLVGSEQIEDAQAMLHFSEWLQNQTGTVHQLGTEQWQWLLSEMTNDGSPLMQGLALGLNYREATHSSNATGQTIGTWVDAAASTTGRKDLKMRLQGLLLASGPLLREDTELLHPVDARIAQLSDSQFLQRLPALRGGFESLAPSDRQALLRRLQETLYADQTIPLHHYQPTLIAEPEVLADLAAADAVGWETAQTILATISEEPTTKHTLSESSQTQQSRQPHHSQGTIPTLHRWRLILGHVHETMPPLAQRAAKSLDALYGHSIGDQGEADSQGGGQGAPQPGVREWSQELEDLMGGNVREEVLAQASAEGHVAAALALDPNQVQPSVALLETVLSLKGALPESKLSKLREIVNVLIKRLTEILAQRMRPALAGLLSPRPHRKPSRQIHFPRTIGANLKHCRPEKDSWKIYPERIYFKAPQRRSMDWDIILVVDVSSSMEPSVIHSAIMAAIFTGLPSLRVRFLAFSTEVIDFSDQAGDPLSLLLGSPSRRRYAYRLGVAPGPRTPTQTNADHDRTGL